MILNAFEENTSFESAFGEYELIGWYLLRTAKELVSCADNLAHDNDFGNGGQGSSDGAAVEVSEDSLDYLLV